MRKRFAGSDWWDDSPKVSRSGVQKPTLHGYIWKVDIKIFGENQ